MADLSQRPTSPPNPPLVLLVDDDPDTCELFGLFLTDSGFVVQDARGAKEALAKIKSAVPDVVVTDLVLPDMDGFALCREIKGDQRTAAIPVIAVTGYSSPARLEEAERAGFDAFIMKPCVPDDLLAQIRATIERTRSLCACNTQLRAESARLIEETKQVREQSAADRKRRAAEDAPWHRGR